jgi:protein-tyrosine phosphatase
VKQILVVCTANICRSPMAAALLRARLASLGLSAQIEVLSAGVWAQEGQAASSDAIAVLAERDIDLAPHRSQRVSLPLLEKADLILVMEEAHRRSLFYLAPQHLAKVFLLTEMAGRHEDVADPYGSGLNDYQRTVALLDQLVITGLPSMLKRLGIAESAKGAPGAQ